ncbi:MAG: hypothetical protein JNJ59_13580, partial [Deltaproteobacteria bacterium]|nr:hypothetical protein [Deltaproteobacteria bacterium]
AFGDAAGGSLAHRGTADTQDAAWWESSSERAATPLTVLVVERVAAGRRLRRELARAPDLRVESAGSIELARAMLKLQRFDALILDGELPSLTDAMAIIRAEPHASTLPVLVVGAGGLIEDAVRVATEADLREAITRATRPSPPPAVDARALGPVTPKAGPRPTDVAANELSALYSSTSAAILGVDSRSTCIYVNPAAALLYAAQDAGDLVSRALGDLVPKAVLEAGHGEVLRFDGTLAPVRVEVQSVHAGAGRIERVVTLQDLSAEREREQRLFQAQKLVAIGQLTGGISHDFSNLLTIVCGNLTELVRVSCLEGETREMAEDALSAALDGMNLTRHLVAVAREQRLRPRAVDLGLSLQELGRLLRRILKRKTVLEVRAAEGVAAVLDRTQLESAVMNLVLNAQHAQHPDRDVGHIVVEVDTAVELRHGREQRLAQVTVADDGLGMDEETVRRATEPFFTTRRDSGGTGLGLAMVQSMAQAFGGTLHIESTLGVGTRVTLRFPWVNEAAPRTAMFDRDEEPPLGRERKALVIEPDARLRRYAARLLTAVGQRVFESIDAEGGKDLLVAQPELAIVFLDLRVAESRQGRELVRWIARTRPDLAVVVTLQEGEPTTNLSMPDAAAFLRKPYSEVELRRILAEILPRDP